jgi:phage FluMu protein Com
VGIRFRCHQCGYELHVKDFQGGKRSKCPECETKFRIPAESTDYSIPLDNPLRDDSSASTSQIPDIQASQTQPSQVHSAGRLAVGTLPTTSSITSTSSFDSEPQVGAQESELQNLDSVSDSAVPATPQAILEAPGATWYVRPPAGGQYGPAPADIFCEWLTESRVTRDSLVWRDGWPQWLVASEVFADYFGPAQPPTVPDATGLVAAPTIAQIDSPLVGMPPPEQAAAPEFVAPTSLSDRALAARKRQRKQNYLIMIGILSAISVGLVIALAVVLMKNM